MHRRWLLAATALSVSAWTAADTLTIQPRLLTLSGQIKSIPKALYFRGRYVVVDYARHRLVFFDEELREVRSLGRIGQGAGEFFRIHDLAIDERGRLYVSDDSGTRLQILSWEGEPLGQMRIAPTPVGLAVNSKGHVLVGQPQKGFLVTEYSREGVPIKSFGELHKLSDFYGSGLAELDDAYREAINRVWLAVDNQDNVYVAFLGAPYFQKYGPNGNLLFERRVESPLADLVVSGFQEKKKSPMRRGIDSVPTPGVVMGIAVTPAGQRIILACQWDRAGLYVADGQGNPLASLDWEDSSLLLQGLSVGREGNLLATRLSVVHENELYEVDLPVPLRTGTRP